jgi:hypothetical protein
MTDYTLLAGYEIRNAIWEELQNANLFDINDYYPDNFADPLVPIIPGQQIPELNNLLPGKDFMTYDISQKRTNVQWWMSNESMTFTIVSRDNARIMTIINFLTDLFRRYDLSAKDINLQLSKGSPFNFLSFNVEYSDPIQPFTDEGGYMSGVFTIGYSYTRDIVDGYSGRFA